MGFVDLIRKVRPAPIQVLLLTVMGANRRREMRMGDLSFYADPTSGFGLSVAQGEYEPDLTTLVKEHLAPGATFLDMGANEGFFTVLGSKLVGPSGRVIAVEPQSRLGPVILKNLVLNGCANCVLVQAAVGDCNGEITIHLHPTTNTAGSSIFHLRKYPTMKEVVKSYTLEDLMDQVGIEKFDFVKVDIEGAEYGVFMAAEEVLRSGRLARIALEFHSSILRKQGLDERKLDRHLRECGYALESELPRVYAFQGIGTKPRH